MASQESVRLTAQARTGSFAPRGVRISTRGMRLRLIKNCALLNLSVATELMFASSVGGLTGLATALELTERGGTGSRARSQPCRLGGFRTQWRAYLFVYALSFGLPYLRDFGKDGAARVFAMTREGARADCPAG